MRQREKIAEFDVKQAEIKHKEAEVRIEVVRSSTRENYLQSICVTFLSSHRSPSSVTFSSRPARTASKSCKPSTWTTYSRKRNDSTSDIRRRHRLNRVLMTPERPSFSRTRKPSAPLRRALELLKTPSWMRAAKCRKLQQGTWSKAKATAASRKFASVKPTLTNGRSK